MASFNIFKNLKAFFTTEKAFLKNVSLVFSGRVYVAILGLILTPVITRLFTPEAYGEFALYSSVVQNLVILSTLALPAALNTGKKDNLSSIYKLALTTIGLFSIIFTILFFALKSSWTSQFSILSNYWYLIPLGSFLSSLTLTLNSLHLRFEHFTLATKISVVESLTAKGITITNGLLQLASLGLIISDLTAKLLSTILLLRKLPATFTTNIILGWQEVKRQFILAKKYPLFVMPAQWVSILSTQLILWFLAYQFSADDLGFYTVALSLLNIPMHILSNSFQPVITQQFVAARDGLDKAFSMKKPLTLLFIISFTVFGGLYLIPSTWFEYFLGNQWQGIGTFIKILCWWNLVLFIDQAINNGFLVFEKQRQKLYLNLVDLALQAGLLIVAFISPIELINLIAFFVVAKVMASVLRIGYLSTIGLRLENQGQDKKAK